MVRVGGKGQGSYLLRCGLLRGLVLRGLVLRGSVGGLPRGLVRWKMVEDDGSSI